MITYEDIVVQHVQRNLVQAEQACTQSEGILASFSGLQTDAYNHMFDELKDMDLIE